jgi:hypothetical protein
MQRRVVVPSVYSVTAPGRTGTPRIDLAPRRHGSKEGTLVMDFGRMQEAQERRRQELREAQRRALLLYELQRLERLAAANLDARRSMPAAPAPRSRAGRLRRLFANVVLARRRA